MITKISMRVENTNGITVQQFSKTVGRKEKPEKVKDLLAKLVRHEYQYFDGFTYHGCIETHEFFNG